MDDEYERSLVAWANTFNSSFPVSTTPVLSFADFSSGDALIPIAQAIVGHDRSVDDDEAADGAAGWTGVVSHMKPAGLIGEDAELIEQATKDVAKAAAMAVTCLEALLRHSVGEQCNGREAFIRQIMSLDASAQSMLRHIIVDGQPQQHQHQYEDGSGSEAGSPSRESHLADESFAGSSTPDVANSLAASTPERRGKAGSSCGDNDSNSDNRSFNSWFSPHAKDDARERNTTRTPRGDRAAPVGPKRQRMETANMDTTDSAEALLVAAADCCAPPVLPASVGGAGYAAATAMEVTDLRTEVVSLRTQLEESEKARSRVASVADAQSSAAAAREAELSEELLRSRQAAARAACSGEDDVIAMENAMRGKHEREVAELQARATESEQRLLLLEPLEEEVERLRDEVDVLRPMEACLSKTEENLARCRDRMEELGDFPGRLKKEEDAHAEVLDRCLALEAEVAQIPALRRQLDSYRRSKTDMEVASREQSLELKLAQEEVSRLSEEVRALADSSGSVKKEHQKLQEDLRKRAVEEAERSETGGGIGQGVSELNPELTEELARLRRQNEQLAAKVDYNTVETIQDLEQKAGDANRLTESFHANLTSERQLRASAEESLATTRARIAKLETELAVLREERRTTIACLEAEAAAAAAAAAAALVASREESRDALAAAELAAARALEAECAAGAGRLTDAKMEAERVAEGLRAEMAEAEEAAAVAAATVREERVKERAEFEAEVAAREKEAVEEGERVRAEKSATEEAYSREKEEMEAMAARERLEAREKEVKAAEAMADATRAFESELAEVKRESQVRLEEGRALAASELEKARGETAEEERGRAEESRLKDEAVQEVKRLEGELSTGKAAALTAIERLKANARELREEAALMRQQVQEDCEEKIAVLNGEFDQYRKAHTVDDASYLRDMHEWDGNVAAQKKIVAGLQAEAAALKKDKRRLEREKTFYWGQAEELRMSAVAGGRADPSRDADHAQLVEQTKELIKENRELKQRVLDTDGTGGGGGGGGGNGVSTRSGGGGGRWGSSGVAAMRAEHESEVVALKEQKQDMLLKYHATSSRLHEQERRCAEQEEGMEEMRSQIVKLQLVCKRQEKKLSTGLANATTATATLTTDASMHKENRASNTTTSTSSSSKSQPRDVKLKKRSSRRLGGDGGGGPEENGVSTTSQAFSSAEVAGAVAHGRALRGLTNATREHGAAQAAPKQKHAVKEDGRVSGDEETPPDCVQS